MKRAVITLEADRISWGELKLPAVAGGAAHQTARLFHDGQLVCLLHVEWPRCVVPNGSNPLGDIRFEDAPERGERD